MPTLIKEYVIYYLNDMSHLGNNVLISSLYYIYHTRNNNENY